MHSSFSGDSAASLREAREVIYATGTTLTRVGGALATDGGLTRGRPTFQDEGRPAQLVVDAFQAHPRLPMRMTMSYSLTEAVAAIEQGQDAALAFLQSFLSPGGPHTGSTGGMLSLLAAAPPIAIRNDA